MAGERRRPARSSNEMDYTISSWGRWLTPPSSTGRNSSRVTPRRERPPGESLPRDNRLVAQAH
ncbi:MAG: hypothetical protein ABI355_19580 [Solirubrobacteraceae bacterium]